MVKLFEWKVGAGDIAPKYHGIHHHGHETTISENIFGTFSKHSKQIQI